ncbi:glycerol-3-phosphate dehydrogenase/oxidase [Nakamurella flavida]|uniref:Glycerol-3-phosphate dehydrogenase/oxidase n=1 Tax=Nakamurella flavida TaxID=363630 RepID=A0A938YKG4_9ACTN|nr:glycerol-3-phosphate dehydrogenase/oxidase [Nakamurella flavida]MBM9475092.1 glycerol-3-phosphate dehydrogenase/oxidase [Nakamurella flavida]MDP9776662.1 glycerol-3-phosphate dehydrogenase [Nakamurella flavida]
MVRPELTGEPFDVIVVGAGINGVGIAQDAALRGLRVVLVEQDDLCSGVSAWSGRLVHGGLRYLEQYDVGLVYESLNERERLFKLAPHLVKPKPLMVPVYKHNRRPGWMVELGMIAYDALSLRKTPPYHRALSKKKTTARFTGVGTDGLSGSVVFYDGQVENAERLCVELAVDAAAAGAVIALKTRVQAPLLENGRVVGVRAQDTITGETFEIRGSVVYNVAGAAIDRLLADPSLPAQPRLNGGTKGSHLIVDPFPGAPTDVVYYESRQDGRLVLIIPWRGRYMIGTTDIRFDQDPDEARCDIGEVDYLLGEVNTLIPEANLSLQDVLYTFSGVRPLPYVPDKAESAVPRSHVLHDHGDSGLPGLVTIVGGKLTTYRQLAQDTIDDAFRRLGRKAPPVSTKNRRYPGAQFVDLDTLKASVAGRTGLPADQVTRLVDLYGSRAFAVWQLAERYPELNRTVHPSGVLAAELVFALDEDLARSLTDVLARRVLLAFEPGHALEEVDDITKVIADHLDQDDAWAQAQIAEYREWLDKLKVPDPDGPRSESFGAGVVVGASS